MHFVIGQTEPIGKLSCQAPHTRMHLAWSLTQRSRISATWEHRTGTLEAGNARATDGPQQDAGPRAKW